TSCGVASVEPTWPLRLSPELLVRDAAAPTVAVAVNVTGLPVSAGAVAVSVFAPAVGPSVHDRTAATPSVPAMTGVVGSTVPLPVATAKLTETPLTGLPPASCSWSTGCCASGAPLCAALEGWVVMLRRAAAPAVPVAVKVTGLPLIPDPAAAAVSVLAPAADPSVHDVAAATPFAPVG